MHELNYIGYITQDPKECLIKNVLNIETAIEEVLLLLKHEKALKETNVVEHGGFINHAEDLLELLTIIKQENLKIWKELQS